jgi:hypothetical protein
VIQAGIIAIIGENTSVPAKTTNELAATCATWSITATLATGNSEDHQNDSKCNSLYLRT